jgi:hypothetical protein
MRRNKEISIITYTKLPEPELHLHCKIHRACRMIRLADGLRCQICGGGEVATKTVFTFMKEPVSLGTQALGQEGVNNN